MRLLVVVISCLIFVIADVCSEEGEIISTTEASYIDLGGEDDEPGDDIESHSGNSSGDASGEMGSGHEISSGSGSITISTTVMTTTDLKTTDLKTTDLKTTDMKNTDMTTTDLITTDLKTTDLKTTDLTTTDLKTTDLKTTDMITTDMKTTDMQTSKTSSDSTGTEIHSSTSSPKTTLLTTDADSILINDTNTSHPNTTIRTEAETTTNIATEMQTTSSTTTISNEVEKRQSTTMKKKIMKIDVGTPQKICNRKFSHEYNLADLQYYGGGFDFVYVVEKHPAGVYSIVVELQKDKIMLASHSYMTFNVPITCMYFASAPPRRYLLAGTIQNGKHSISEQIYLVSLKENSDLMKLQSTIAWN